MKKFNSQFLTLGVLFFALLTCVQSFAQEMKYSNMRDGNGITVNVAVDDFSFESLTYKGEEMQEINISGINLPNDAGMPNLPRVSRYIAVPQGAEAKITVRNISTETIENVNLAPALEIQAEVEEPAMDYKKNEKVYSTNAMYPAQMYELSEPTSVRGVDAVILGVTPFQYNPVTKQLVVVRSIDIDVEFIGGNNHYGEDRYRSRWFD
ncbi:MAG: C25 family peptidase propeptide domain-containing protein, partial [Bacteroidales bacterium]|nr:C25 family peptidase propeptide domain-containing protein [Bacteroidales bacterium]